MKKYLIVPLALLATLPKVTFAHCPLCTAGAGALALLAISLGVSRVVIGIGIGAFSVALALWIAPLVKKQYIPFQNYILAVGMYLLTVIPLLPLVREYAPLYIAWGGDYGTLLHNTYTINLFILGIGIGTIIMLISPYASKLLTYVRGTRFPYQGVSITLGLLIVASLFVQFWPW